MSGVVVWSFSEKIYRFKNKPIPVFFFNVVHPIRFPCLTTIVYSLKNIANIQFSFVLIQSDDRQQKRRKHNIILISSEMVERTLYIACYDHSRNIL